MGYPIYHSQYTAAQIEASIGKTPRIKAATRTWEIWDIATSAYVDTGVSIDTELFVDNTLTEAGYAADAKVTGDKLGELKSAINFTNTYVMDEKAVALPDTVRGNFRITPVASGDMVISGTYNVAELFNMRQGTVTINGTTITVSGNDVSISGQPSADFNYEFVSGEKRTSTELTAMTLGLPVHQYTLSQKVTRGSVFPAICIRSKSSGNVSVAQNNTNVFTMITSTCGGFYIPLQSNKNYDCAFTVALLPFSADNGNIHRGEASDITVYEDAGIYALNGYTWYIGTPSIEYLESKLPRKPKCLYSTRSIDYSSMSKCLDVYIPCKYGYTNYVMGYVNKPADNGEVWRIIQIDAVNDALEYKFHITQQGETEMAIMLTEYDESTHQYVNRSDFIGGTTHGDEIMNPDSFVVLLDGKKVDVETLTSLTEFETLQLFLVSNMYDPADNTTLVGVHGREWAFDGNGLILAQTVEFKEDCTLSGSYMPMLCVLRGNDTASALQVTDTYIDDGNFMPYDVSVGGFTTYPNQLKSDVRTMYLIGETSGVEAELAILEQPEGLNQEGVFLYNVANTYNKLYCCMCGYGGGNNVQAVHSGDKWKVKSKISIVVG